jgi:iron complex transport system ATP-binding protein
MSLLCATDLHAAYGRHPVLGGVDVSLAAGEVLGIIGGNGAGKTTLLRLLAGLAVPSAGEVRLHGEPLQGGAQIARMLAYLEQQTLCHWPVSVQELVALGRLPHLGFGQSMRHDDYAAVEQALAEADVLHLRQRPATEISTGELARVLLARALAVQPQALLVDEPVAGLDPAHQLTVMQLLRRKAAEGMGVVAVLHDLALAARFCDRLLLLHQGVVVAQGAPATVLTPAHLRQALQVEVVTGEHEGQPYLLPWTAC